MTLSPVHSERPEDRVSIVNLLVLVGRRKKRIAVCTALGGVVFALVAVLLPSTFTGLTRTLVPQQSQSLASAMLNQLGGLANLAGGSGGFKNPGDIYIDMLKSNTVQDRIIDRFHLLERYHASLRSDARQTLLQRSRFAADRSGVLTIEVDDRDPSFAADMANAYVDELYGLTNVLAISEAAQRRLFFEKQLQDTKDKLASLESKARTSIASGGLASLEAQGQATVETIAKLRAAISAKDVQLGAMSTYASAANPERQRAEQELASMRSELRRLEVGEVQPKSPPSESAIAGQQPSGADNVRLLREVKYTQGLFEFLSKQYEIARLDEGKEAPVIQVMDRAQPAERRSSPRRAQLVMIGVLGGFMLGIGWCLLEQAMINVRADSDRRALWEAARKAWLGR